MLNVAKTKYSNEEVKKIRDFLYKLGQLDYKMSKKLKKSQYANSNNLHESIN